MTLLEAGRRYDLEVIDESSPEVRHVIDAIVESGAGHTVTERGRTRFYLTDAQRLSSIDQAVRYLNDKD